MLLRHLKRKKPCVPEEVPVITGENDENRCQFCNNTFSSKSNLKRHQRENCKNDSNLETMVTRLLEKVDEQGENMAKMEKQLTNPNQTVNIDNRSVNIMKFVNFPLQDMSQIDMAPILQIVNSQPKNKIIPDIVEHLHGNPDYPEQQNVYITEMVADVTIVYGESTLTPNQKTWHQMPRDETFVQLKNEAMGLITHNNRPMASMKLLEIAAEQKLKDTSYQNKIQELSINDTTEDESLAEKLVYFGKRFHAGREIQAE